MKCLAIGDMFIPARHFDAALTSAPQFTGYQSIAWREDENRARARDTVRRIETMGSLAFEPTDEILEKIANAEVLCVHLCPVPGSLIERAPKLRYILTARGGVENIDIDAVKRRGITVINCPAHNAVAVAEYAIGLMLCEMRNIARSREALRQGIWRERFDNSDAIPELSTSTVGIVGFGTIGRLVAERLRAFGARVLVSDPYVDPKAVRAEGCIPVGLDELLEASDVVTLHGRIAASDPPLIGEGQLSKMKPTAILINTARAVLVDMEALGRALAERRIMGAAIDVFPKEPLAAEDPMPQLDNATLTNHRGGDTLNSYILAPALLLEQFRELLETGTTRCMIR